MPFWSRLPVEFDPDSGGLVPVSVTRQRHQAHLRECYPMLYLDEDEGATGRRGGFAVGFVSGAAVLALVWLGWSLT